VKERRQPADFGFLCNSASRPAAPVSEDTQIGYAALSKLLSIHWRFGDEQKLFAIVRRNAEAPMVAFEFGYEPCERVYRRISINKNWGFPGRKVVEFFQVERRPGSQGHEPKLNVIRIYVREGAVPVEEIDEIQSGLAVP